MKNLILTSVLLFLLGPAAAHAQSPIVWQEGLKLRYTDISGTAPANRGASGARTNTAIFFDYDEVNGRLVPRIQCQFNPSKSWMVVQTPELLAHEQIHFDLTELYARKLYREILKVQQGDDLVAVANQWIAIYQRINEDMSASQKRYDAESAHSQNKVRQAEWEAKIRESLIRNSGSADYPR